MELSYDHMCFGCGDKNPYGLKLRFEEEGEKIIASFRPSEFYQGYPGFMHGGIASTILDEVMSRCLNVLGHLAVTGRLEVRFRKKVPINQTLQCEGWIVKQKGPAVDTEGRIILADGSTAIEAKARFMIIGKMETIASVKED